MSKGGSNYYSSSYVTARGAHVCGDCGALIYTGLLYLSFAQKNPDGRRDYPLRVPVCLACSVKVNERGAMRWACKAVSDRRAEFGDNAGLQPQGQLL